MIVLTVDLASAMLDVWEWRQAVSSSQRHWMAAHGSLLAAAQRKLAWETSQRVAIPKLLHAVTQKIRRAAG